jgi:hypothetical protein
MTMTEIITALQAAKIDIADAITAKGGTVAAGDGFSDFAAAIASISAGPEYGLITFTAVDPAAAIIMVS